MNPIWLVLVATYLAGCAQSVDPSPTSVMHPSTAASLAGEADAQMPADVVAIRAYSAGFGTHAERTDELTPDLVVFSDGLVVGRVDTPPEAARFKAIRVDAETMSELQAAIDALGVRGLLAPYDPSFHSADAMTIVRARQSDGTIVDIAVVALEGGVLPPPSTVPDAVIGLDARLLALREQVRQGDGVDWSRDLPEVPGVQAPLD